MSEKTVYVIELNDKLSPGLKKAAAAALGLDNAIDGVNKNGGKSMGGLKSSIMGLVPALAGAAVAMKAFQFASESVKSAREFESLTNSITFAAGSAKEGAKTMAFLRSRSELLGTDLLSASEGYKTLSAAMMGSSLEGQATKDIFDGVQVAVSAMGLDAENAKGTFLALGQIMGKGKVQAEELRGQIGERIPGAFNIAARAMGVSTQKLNKMMEQGQLMSEDFLPKFANELKKTFGGALPKSVNSSAAQFNRFKNTMLELKVELGNSLIPMINRLIGSFKDLYFWIKDRSEFFYDTLIKPLMDFGEKIQPIFSGIAKSIGSIFGIDSADGLVVGLSALFQDLVIAAEGIVVPILDVIGTLTDAFSDLFSFIKSDGEETFGQFLTGNLVYTSKAISELVKGNLGVMKGALTGNDALMNQSMDRIWNLNANANKAANESVNKQKQAAKDRKWNLSQARGAAVNRQRLREEADRQNGLKDLLTQKDANGKAIGADGKPTKTATSTVDEIKSGRPMNIYIDINKMIESFNVTATNLDDMNNKAKDLVAQALLSAVNNVNLIAR